MRNTLKDRATTIYIGLEPHKGYLTDEHCKGCPYVTEDAYGGDACFIEEFKACQHNKKSKVK